MLEILKPLSTKLKSKKLNGWTIDNQQEPKIRAR
jgi:hypothetical protein